MIKNFTLTVLLAVAVVMGASAQNPSNPALDKATIRLTRAMVETMQLNEGEYIKLKKLNQMRLAQASEAEKMYVDDAEMRDARLKEIDEEFEQQLFTMLNSRQVEAYADFKQKPEGNFLAVLQEESASTSKKK